MVVLLRVSQHGHNNHNHRKKSLGENLNGYNNNNNNNSYYFCECLPGKDYLELNKSSLLLFGERYPAMGTHGASQTQIDRKDL